MKLINFVNKGPTVGAVNVPEIQVPFGGLPLNHTRITSFHKNLPGVLRVRTNKTGLGPFFGSVGCSIRDTHCTTASY